MAPRVTLYECASGTKAVHFDLKREVEKDGVAEVRDLPFCPACHGEKPASHPCREIVVSLKEPPPLRDGFYDLTAYGEEAKAVAKEYTDRPLKEMERE